MLQGKQSQFQPCEGRGEGGLSYRRLGCNEGLRNNSDYDEMRSLVETHGKPFLTLKMSTQEGGELFCWACLCLHLNWNKKPPSIIRKGASLQDGRMEGYKNSESVLISLSC